MPVPTIGVIGTGHFASYFIAALRNGGHEGRILLSPHSRDKAAALAREQRCELASDDKALVEAADWVLLAVRPQHLATTLSAKNFRPGQILLSAVAGVPMAELRRQALGAETIVRLMPSSYIECMSDGLIPMFPRVQVVEQVLARAGTVMPFDTEDQFDLSLAAACMSGWVYRFVDSLSQWFADKGMPAEQARRLVTGNIMGALAYAEANRHSDLKAISDGIATEGTYTKAGLDLLRARGAFDQWVEGLDTILDKIKAN